MIGTTRSRVNLFMNRFRKLGFVDYGEGGMRIHSSLLISFSTIRLRTLTAVANLNRRLSAHHLSTGLGTHEWDQEQVKGIEQAVREKPSLAFDLLISPTENALPKMQGKLNFLQTT